MKKRTIIKWASVSVYVDSFFDFRVSSGLGGSAVFKNRNRVSGKHMDTAILTEF